MTNNDNYIVKEYFDLNGHYLRLSFINNKDIHIISYNTSLLNGIKYETLIKSEEITQKAQGKNFSSEILFGLITQKIGENKFIIKSEPENVNIVLLETQEILGIGKDIVVMIPRNKTHITTEYEKVLSHEIIKLKELKEENKNMMNEISQLKNMVQLLSCIQENNNNNNSMNNRNNNNIKNSNNSNNNLKGRHSRQFTNSSNIKSSSNKMNVSQNENKNSNNIENNPSLNKGLNNSHKNTNNSSLNQSKNNINKINDNNINNNNNNSNNPQLNGNSSDPKNNKNKNDLSISILSNLKFGNYPAVELSPNSFFVISGYGANSYNGTVRKYNEDRLKIILDYKLKKVLTDSNGQIINPKISYFAIYDGHGGEKCSNFLQKNLHENLFSSDEFPLNPLIAIYQAYEKTELDFESIAFDKENKKLLDKSGSCALSALIIDEYCFITYLGDSRAIYSFDSGKSLYQVTRDHKPNDNVERARIIKAGGKIYKDTRLKVDGLKVRVNEKDAPGFKFPYRVSPGNLAVSIYIIFNLYFIRLQEALEI